MARKIYIEPDSFEVSDTLARHPRRGVQFEVISGSIYVTTEDDDRCITFRMKPNEVAALKKWFTETNN
jgi:hypothetical protein